MNPAFECFGFLTAKDLTAYLTQCMLPAMAVNEDFKVIAKNRILTSYIPGIRNGVKLDRYLSSSQEEALRFMSVGQVEYMEFMAKGISGATVSRFENCYVFCFKPVGTGFSKQAAEVVRAVSHSTPEIIEFCSRMDVAPISELQAFKSLSNAHMLRQANAGYMLELASDTGLRYREYFEPSEAINSVCRISEEELEKRDISLFTCVDPSAEYCYGVRDDFYTVMSAMLSFGGTYCSDDRIYLAANFWDKKYVIRLEFKSKLDEDTVSCYYNGEMPFDYDQKKGVLSEQMVFMQCVANSNDWYFYVKRESGKTGLVLVLPLSKAIDKTTIKRPVSDRAFMPLVLAQLAGLGEGRKGK